MTIVSFTFDRISAERTGKIKEKVDINHNFNINNIEKTDVVVLQGKKTAIKISFDFNVTYEPNIGKIKMSGDIVYLDKEDEISKLLDQWKKTKNLPVGVTSLVANTVLTKANIKALMLSQEVNLLPQIQLPKVIPKEMEESKDKGDYIG